MWKGICVCWMVQKGFVGLYFAYGSNLWMEQFRQRCPFSRYICNARLSGYKFAIVCEDDPRSTASGYATVLPQEGSKVFGVLCDLAPEDEKILDEKEDVEKGDYIKEWLVVQVEPGGSFRALVYVSKLTKEGCPNKGYMEKIITGAESHCLPAAYIAELKSWANKDRH